MLMNPLCYVLLPKRLYCEFLTWMQVKLHVISLQSMTLFVRLTNHHCGKLLMFRSTVNEGKRGKKLFSAETTILHGAAAKRLEQETGAHASGKPS